MSVNIKYLQLLIPFRIEGDAALRISEHGPLVAINFLFFYILQRCLSRSFFMERSRFRVVRLSPRESL